MSFKDLDDFFDPTLRLPIRGKVYVVKSPDAKLGVKVQRLVALGFAAAGGADMSAADLDSLNLDDEQERDLYPRLLGDAYTEMVDDDLPWEWVKHAGSTALMWVGAGIEAAEEFWESAPGEPRRPEPQDHKAPAKKATTRKTSSTRTTSAKAASPAGSTPPSAETSN